jgi:hypothetical protein
MIAITRIHSELVFLTRPGPEKFYVLVYVHREIRGTSPKVVGSNPAIPTI